MSCNENTCKVSVSINSNHLKKGSPGTKTQHRSWTTYILIQALSHTSYCIFGKLLNLLMVLVGFPGGSVVKQSACQCRRCRFDPWVGKIPGELQSPYQRGWVPTSQECQADQMISALTVLHSRVKLSGERQPQPLWKAVPQLSGRKELSGGKRPASSSPWPVSYPFQICPLPRHLPRMLLNCTMLAAPSAAQEQPQYCYHLVWLCGLGQGNNFDLPKLSWRLYMTLVKRLAQS